MCIHTHIVYCNVGFCLKVRFDAGRGMDSCMEMELQIMLNVSSAVQYKEVSGHDSPLCVPQPFH